MLKKYLKDDQLFDLPHLFQHYTESKVVFPNYDHNSKVEIHKILTILQLK